MVTSKAQANFKREIYSRLGWFTGFKNFSMKNGGYQTLILACFEQSLRLKSTSVQIRWPVRFSSTNEHGEAGSVSVMKSVQISFTNLTVFFNNS